MRKNVTRAGLLTTAGLGAAALAVGFAMPAMADDHGSSAEDAQTSVSAPASLEGFQAWVDQQLATYGNDTDAGNVGIDGPLVEGPLVSDIGNGAIGSGNDVPVLSGNDVSAPVGSGNEVGKGNVVGSGNDTGVSVGDVGTSVGDLTTDIGNEVDSLVGDIGSDVDSLVGGLLD